MLLFWSRLTWACHSWPRRTHRILPWRWRSFSSGVRVTFPWPSSSILARRLASAPKLRLRPEGRCSTFPARVVQSIGATLPQRATAAATAADETQRGLARGLHALNERMASAAQEAETLLTLELNGRIRQLPGQHYIRL